MQQNSSALLMRSEQKLTATEVKLLQFNRMPARCERVLLPHFEARLRIVAQKYPLAPKRELITLVKALILNNFHERLLPLYQTEVIDRYRRWAEDAETETQKKDFAEKLNFEEQLQATLRENAPRVNINPGEWVKRFHIVEHSGASRILDKKVGSVPAHKAKLWLLMVRALQHIPLAEEPKLRERLTSLLGLNLQEELVE